MSTPLVTVYITNHNYGSFIAEAIESVLSQTFQNIEILIIDDGSTDNSQEIIEAYSSYKKINVIYQKNKGLNTTNNIALRSSSGKYIVRLDADDYFDQNAIELMVNEMELNPELGLVFPDYWEVDSQGNKLSLIKRHDFNEVTLLDQPAHGACTMIRREYLVDLNGYDERYTCQDGYELWVKFVTEHKVANINVPLFYYRQHGKNLTSNEEKILNTRMQIKTDYVFDRKVSIPCTIAIIPVRSVDIDSHAVYLTQVGNETLLGLKIRYALKSNHCQKVIVTSSDDDVKSYIEKKYSGEPDIIFHRRPKDLGRYNVSLRQTVAHVLKHPQVIALNPEAFIILSLEFPFINNSHIDDAINTLSIFNSDSLISVRPDNSSFYLHNGHGMNPILDQEKISKLERELLYKYSGGIIAARVQSFSKSDKLLHGRVGHISISQKSALGVDSKFDLEMIKLLAEKEYPS